jgi:hypothetical protein
MPDTGPDHLPSQALSPGAALRLLHALRDGLVDAASNAYAERLKDARTDLSQLAQRASEASRRELYESGYALLANGGLGLLRRFRDIYCHACDHAIGVLNGRDGDAWASIDELALVEANAFERDLAVARLSAKAGYACAQQMTALERRIAALLGLKRLDTDGNPFAVKRLFSAFVDAAEAHWAGAQLSLVLLETFEHYTAERLPDIYRALNQQLVDAGVLPKLPVETEERTRELERRHRTGGDTMGDIFVQLTSGIMGARGRGDDGQGGGGYGLGNGYAGGGGAPAGGGAAPGGTDPTGGRMAPMVLSQLIDGLTGLQRGSGSAAEKLGITLDTLDTESSAVLRSLGASPLLRWLQPQDAVTIELVAMLFDCIFSDGELPAHLRGHIGKLQVPILKVALLNKAFFSDRRHPARRLLDVMAAGARGWSGNEEGALLARIKAAVDNVLAAFEKDTDVFQSEAEQIESLLHEAERAARGQVGELVQRLEQRDRQLVAETVVADQLARRLNGQRLPEAVTSFIEAHWRELLGRIYVKLGDGGEDWHAALATLDDLVWSVQPKATPEDRRRLMHLLPCLLDQLPAGLARIGREAAWEPFLAELMTLHMAAIRPSEPAPAEASPAPETETEAAPAAGDAPADAPDTDALPWLLHSDSELAPSAPQDIEPDSTLADEAASAEVSDLSESQAAAAAEAAACRDAYFDAACAVELGDWLEVQQLGGANLSLRASWMSPQSGLILFADRRGRNARVLSTERLATALRQGSARLLSRDPLTDRAVAKLLVQAAPAEQTAA